MIARDLDSEAAGHLERSIASDSGMLCIWPVALIRRSTQLFQITMITMNEFFFVNVLLFLNTNTIPVMISLTFHDNRIN